MAEFWTRITQDGRVVVPAEIRKRLGLRAGGNVKVTIESFDQSLREAQDLIARYVEPGVSLADELSADRRREAQRE
jgi:AbrB family looped-hinge helix DNA binding protein